MINYLSKSAGANEANLSNKSKTYKIVVRENFRYINFSLYIDNSQCKNKLEYYLINPKGETVLKGKVDGGNISSIKEKKYKNTKGTWIIKIEKTEESAKYIIKETYDMYNI